MYGQCTTITVLQIDLSKKWKLLLLYKYLGRPDLQCNLGNMLDKINVSKVFHRVKQEFLNNLSKIPNLHGEKTFHT